MESTEVERKLTPAQRNLLLNILSNALDTANIRALRASIVVVKEQWTQQAEKIRELMSIL